MKRPHTYTDDSGNEVNGAEEQDRYDREQESRSEAEREEKSEPQYFECYNADGSCTHIPNK